MKTAAKRVPKPKPPLEKEIQKQIVRFLNLRGWWVYSTSQGYRKERGGTRMTPGLSDLLALRQTTSGPSILFVEVKRPGGAIRPSQTMFLGQCRMAGIPALAAYSLDDVRAYLEEQSK